MKKSSKLHYFFTTALIVGAISFGAIIAGAMPGMGGSSKDKSFASMDTNKDGKVTREEFFARYTEMKDAAFDAIDTNKKGYITEEDWNNFIGAHSKENNDAHSMPMSNGTSVQTSDPNIPDLIPPKK